MTALIAWGALALQLGLTLRSVVAGGRSIAMGIVIYLGYFTILTNILVAVALTAPLVAPASSLGRFFTRPVAATGVAMPIAVVCVVYHLLLREIWDPEGWQLVADLALHYVVPVLFVASWWLAVRKDGLGWADLPKWMLYPAGYLAYMLLRGAAIGHYPYPFLDARMLGLIRTLGNAALLLLGFAGAGVLFLTAARLGRTSAAVRGAPDPQ
ncbi:MAG: Pr6Pr family membrane protein [Thermoanaerobaculia bacterium]